MFKKTITAMTAGICMTMISTTASAHFQMIIPSDDMVKQRENRNLNLDVLFWHPFEGIGMNMVAPVRFGVMQNGKKQDLKPLLQEGKVKDVKGKQFDGYKAVYKMRRPGDHIFYIEPKPYWEPTEDSFIVHYTKVVVNGFGLEEGWDEEVGLKTEIVPLTRPYGLYAGNVFQGIVKVNGRAVPYSEVEIEYFANGSIRPNADPMITQVIKADGNGVFTYAMPKEGWWGFAALNTDNKPMKKDGENKDVELGAVLWVKVRNFK